MKKLSQKKSTEISLKYFLLVEVETTGFIIGFFETQDEADKKMHKLSCELMAFQNISKQVLIEKLSCYKQYKMNGKETLISLASTAIPCGDFCLYLFDLQNMKEHYDIDFNLELFIKERENISPLIEKNPAQIGFSYLLCTAN